MMLVPVLVLVAMSIILSMGVGMHVIMTMVMVMVMVMIMFMLVIVFVVVMMMLYGAAATCCTHNLFYLQFFYSQFLAGEDVDLVSAAGGTGFVIRLNGKFGGACQASSPTRYPIDNQARPVKQRIFRAGLEAELDRLRNDIAQLTYLQNDREDAFSGGSALAYFHDTLGY